MSLFCVIEVIGIIKRKAMIKELAAAYHAECLTYCQELLELQKNVDEASGFHVLVLFSVLCALFIIYVTIDGWLIRVMPQLSLEEPLADEFIPFDAYTVDCS